MRTLIAAALLSLHAHVMADTYDTAFLHPAEDGALPKLTLAGASHLASLALNCVGQEYPNKISHVLNDAGDAATPRELHPAFYGCFDWHSSVHGHWMLVRLLKTRPDLPAEEAIRAAIDANLQAEKILVELQYIDSAGRSSFERTYGWAWLLKLAEELHGWDDPQGQKWSENLKPLADHIESLWLNFLPRQTYPVRTGVHPNTAFGLCFAWDYAVALERSTFQAAIEETAIRYYKLDTNCPANYEPSGTDFLSPSLEEADLMRRVLSPEAYANWFSKFLSALPETLSEPATVTDRTDGHLVHLDGLNLSRAWCMAAISEALPTGHPLKADLQQAATLHLQTALPNIASGSYEGEHWLASFAVYALASQTR